MMVPNRESPLDPILVGRMKQEFSHKASLSRAGRGSSKGAIPNRGTLLSVASHTGL